MTCGGALMQWFDAIDKDRSGHLDVHELQAALALGSLNFSLKTTQAIIRLHDHDGRSVVVPTLW